MFLKSGSEIMKKIKRLLSIASLVFIFCSVSYSQNTPPKDPFDFLILVMDSNMKIDECFNTPFSHGVKINSNFRNEEGKLYAT